MKKDINFLDFVPSINKQLVWKKEENGLVTLEIENKGIFKRITQILFKKPKISYIHLDEKGSRAWLLIDGQKTVLQMGDILEEIENEDKNTAYANLSAFLKTLESYKFIELK